MRLHATCFLRPLPSDFPIEYGFNKVRFPYAALALHYRSCYCHFLRIPLSMAVRSLDSYIRSSFPLPLAHFRSVFSDAACADSWRGCHRMFYSFASEATHGSWRAYRDVGKSSRPRWQDAHTFSKFGMYDVPSHMRKE